VATRPDELGPELILRAITDGRATHTRLFRVSGADTVQLTYGSADDQSFVSSPDARWVAVQRGWKGGDGYRYDTFVLDSNGRDIWRVTDDALVDVPIGWSDDGTRIVIAQHARGRFSLLIADADGRAARDLTAEFELPTNRYWAGAFSPVAISRRPPIIWSWSQRTARPPMSSSRTSGRGPGSLGGWATAHAISTP
jgi:Tol biopolymer transport system component